MTDRDHFAAAALTGLMANEDLLADDDKVAETAYELADAMLRERGRADRDNCVTGNNPEMPCPVTEPMPKEKLAEVSVKLTDAERDAVETAVLEADAHQHAQRAATLRGLLERLK